MSPEAAREADYFSKTPKTDYYLRITDIFVRLRKGPDDKDQAWRQEFPEKFIEPALNGKHVYIENKSIFAPQAFYHAGEEDGRVWIRISKGNKSVKFTMADGESSAQCLVEEKTGRQWKFSQNLGEVKAEDLERVVFYGEVLTGLEQFRVNEKGLLDWPGTSQVNRLPGAVIGNKGV